jgi:hypothetical protein
VNFTILEENISRWITTMLKVQQDTADIILAEMSFKNKVHLLGSLLHRLIRETGPTEAIPDPYEFVRECISQCFRAEELRNQVMHSTWHDSEHDSEARRTLRRKITAKGSRGLHIHEEDFDSRLAADIANFIITVSFDLDQLLLNFPHE